MNTGRQTITILVLILMVLTAQTVSAGWLSNHRGIKGSGDMASEEREVGEFTAIKSSGSIDLEVTIGKERSVVVYFDDNLLDNVVTRSRRGRLEIFAEESYSSRLNCRVEITVPSLEEIVLSGSGDVMVNGLSGGEFTYHVSGSGDLYAEGEVDDVEISISGSGDVDARDLMAKSATVRISGSGDVKVYASESFEGRVTGSGDIEYYGRPDHTLNRVTGSGDIRRR